MNLIAKLGSWLTVLATFVIAITQTTGTIAVLSCLVWLASYLILRKTTQLFNPNRITITSFWYLTYLVMIFFPAFFVFAEQEGSYRAPYLFAVESVLITVPAGWLLASRYFRSQTVAETDSYFSRPICDVGTGSPLMARFWLPLLLAIFLAILHIKSLQTIPLFYLLRNPGDYMTLVNLREESFKLLDSPLLYFYSLARGVLFPYLILVSLGLYLRNRQRKWLFLFCICLGIGMFYAALTLAKAPVAIIILLLGVFTYLYRHGKLSRRIIAALLILILAFPITVIIAVSFSSADVGLLEAFQGVGTRLFFLPSEVVYYYYEVFPSRVDYLHGRSIGKLAWLLGLPAFDTANYVGQYVFPGGLESISMNGAFISDLNADFGLVGVILGGVLTGFVMETFHLYLIRRRKTVFNLACYAFLVVAFWYLNSTSLPIVLASDGAVLSLALTWFFEKPAPFAGTRVQ